MMGSICSQFHWTVGYLLWKVPWITVQMMLADMPWYDYKKKGMSENKDTKSEMPFENMSKDDLKKFIDKVNNNNG